MNLIFTMCEKWYDKHELLILMQIIVEIRAPTNATFNISDTKLSIPVVALVALSTQDDNELLEQLKLRLRRTIQWNQ